MKDSSPVLSEEFGSVFNEGIGLVLSRWSALSLAVDNEWGGRNSRQKSALIHSDIYSWFTLSTEPLYIDDLEKKLYEGLLTLNTQVDDGSVEEIAEKLMIMHEECLDGNYKSVEGLRESSRHRVPVSHIREANDDDDDDDDDDEDDDDNMDVGPGTTEDVGSHRPVIGSSRSASHQNSDDMQVDDPTPQPSADNDDGWVVVKPKRSGGRKK